MPLVCRNLICECVRMESNMSDTTMIQNRTKIYALVPKIEKFPLKKNISNQSDKGKPPSARWLCGDLHLAVKLLITATVPATTELVLVSPKMSMKS